MKKLFLWMAMCFPLASAAQEVETNYYKGVVDKYPIEMIVEKITGAEDGEVYNSYNVRYYYVSQQRVLYMSGQMQPGDTLELTSEAYYNDDEEIETFRGKFGSKSYVGHWKKGEKQMNFKLEKFVPKVPMISYKLKDTFKANFSNEIYAIYTADMHIPQDENLRKMFLQAMTKGAFSDASAMTNAEKYDFFKIFKEEIKDMVFGEDGDTLYFMYQHEQANIIYPYINSDDYLILAHSNYSYTGGAHGHYNVDYYNYSHKHKKILKLADILDVKKDKAIEQLINEEIRKRHNIPAGKKLDEGENTIFIVEKAHLSDNFTISKAGIIFHYGLYELTPYAYGIYSIFVPFSKLKPYMKKGFEL